MEPLWPGNPSLDERAIELLKLSQKLSGKLHPITQRRIAKLLRLMNSYYSNLIEGNVTHPLDLERAQQNDYSKEPRKRAMQIEGLAHIEVQEEFENEVRTNQDLNICSSDFLCRIHKRFYEKLPKEFRMVHSPSGKLLEIIPGEIRTNDVKVGHHIPPTYSSVPRFLKRFEETYDPRSLGSVRKIIAATASHHRLAWIHPFLDGNGRVVRLFTQLYFMRAEVESNGLWSLSRGLARKREAYYSALESADRQRDNDYDGRGNLSAKGLSEFASLILDRSIDQVTFMSGLLDTDSLLDRLSEYATFLAVRGQLDETAKYILTEVCLRGELPRGEVARITGTPDRSARRTMQSLIDAGLLSSEVARGALRLDFPMRAVPFIFPALYPSGLAT